MNIRPCSIIFLRLFVSRGAYGESVQLSVYRSASIYKYEYAVKFYFYADHAAFVGRTHTIVRLETRIRRKDGTEDFGGFVCVLDGFPQPDFVLWVFMCPIIFILFSGYHAEGYHAPPLFPATTPRATTPHRSFAGYHAEGYHARTDEFKLTGYHVCRVPHPSYHTPCKLLGTGRLSHLRVVFSCFSSHRLIRQCFHNHNTTFPPSLTHTARTHTTR